MPYGLPHENILPVWEETGPEEDPRQRLSATLLVSGLYMHLEAVEVDRIDGFNVPKWEVFKHTIELLENDNDCSFQTTQIDGRMYVIIATPFGE